MDIIQKECLYEYLKLNYYCNTPTVIFFRSYLYLLFPVNDLRKYGLLINTNNVFLPAHSIIIYSWIVIKYYSYNSIYLYIWVYI